MIINVTKPIDTTVVATTQKVQAKRFVKTPTVEERDASMKTYKAAGFLVESGEYATHYGAIVDSKYGYAKEFDSVSTAYARALDNKEYLSASEMNVVGNMQDKYVELKEEIEANYSGDELDKRLDELNNTYDFIMKSNVTDFTETTLRTESAINQLKMSFADAYENAKRTKSSEFVAIAYGDLSGWKNSCKEIEKQLDLYKKILSEFKDTTYADDLLKTINVGLVGVEKKKTYAGETLKDSDNKQINEIWSLVEKKAEMIVSTNKAYYTDANRYEAFLSNSAKTAGIDNRLHEILESIK